MKSKIIFFIPLLLLSVLIVSAQDKKQSQSKVKNDTTSSLGPQSLEKEKDYILKTGDQTYIRKRGKLLEVRNDRMVEGMRVTPEGKIIKRQGMEYYLKDGEAMSMDGKVIRFDASQIMNEKLNMVHEQYLSMSEMAQETEQILSLMNEKIRLLNKKNRIDGQKDEFDEPADEQRKKDRKGGGGCHKSNYDKP